MAQANPSRTKHNFLTRDKFFSPIPGHSDGCFECRYIKNPHLYPRENFICPGCHYGYRNRRQLFPKIWVMKNPYDGEKWYRSIFKVKRQESEARVGDNSVYYTYLFAVYVRWDPFAQTFLEFRIDEEICQYCFTHPFRKIQTFSFKKEWERKKIQLEDEKLKKEEDEAVLLIKDLKESLLFKRKDLLRRLKGRPMGDAEESHLNEDGSSISSEAGTNGGGEGSQRDKS